jgi:glycosyltransferase 2 family protein
MTHAGPRHIANPAAVPTRHAAPGRRLPWLRMIGGVAMLVALASALGTGAFAAGLRVVGPWSAAAALALGLASTVFTALRWRLIARRVGLRLEVAEAVAESYRAVFLNSVLPGGVLGDVDRARRHGRDAGDVGRSARVVVLERTAGQVVLIAAALLVLPTHPALIPSLIGGVQTKPVVLIGVGLGVLAAVSVVLLRARRTGAHERWRRAAGKALADLRSGVLARGAWPSVLLLSAGALACYLGLFLVAAYAAGTHASVWQLLPLLLLALMAMGLPISVGGWGPREGVAAVSFWMAGLGAPLGVTVAVAYGVLTLIASLPGAFVVLMGRRREAHRSPAASPAA